MRAGCGRPTTRPSVADRTHVGSHAIHVYRSRVASTRSAIPSRLPSPARQISPWKGRLPSIPRLSPRVTLQRAYRKPADIPEAFDPTESTAAVEGRRSAGSDSERAREARPGSLAQTRRYTPLSRTAPFACQLPDGTVSFGRHGPGSDLGRFHSGRGFRSPGRCPPAGGRRRGRLDPHRRDGRALRPEPDDGPGDRRSLPTVHQAAARRPSDGGAPGGDAPGLR